MRQMVNELAVLILLAFSLIVPVFANGSQDTGTGTSTASNGPVTIELWYGAAATEAGPPPADWKALKIIKDKFNINLKLTALPSAENDQDVKINAAGAGNALPDLFMVRRPVWQILVKQGLIADVSDMYKLMPARCKTHYTEDSIKFTTINGKSYGLASPGSIIKNEGVLIRKDWLDKVGMKAPATTDDLMNVMKAFTFKDPDGDGKDDTYGYGAFIEINNFEEGLGRRLDPVMGAYGVAGTWNLSKKNPGLNVLNPVYFDAMSYVKQMVDQKVIDPNWLSYKKDDFRAAWKQGKFGIMREQNAAYAAASNYKPFDENFPNGSWIVIDPPKGPKGDSAVGVYTANYRIYAVSAKAAKEGKKAKIAQLLEWMSSDEGYYLLGWGERDVNYKLDEKGVPTVNGLADPSKAYTAPEMIPLTQLRNMVYYNGGIEIQARYPAYKTDKSGKIMDPGDVLFDMQTRKWTPCVGSDTLPNPNADLKRFLEQGLLEFLTGKRELTKANWNAWIAEFKKVGGEQWNADGVAYAKANSLLF